MKSRVRSRFSGRPNRGNGAHGPADKGHESVGYPTMGAKRSRSQPRTGDNYLYYAHHDPNSGIGCAVAESVEGPYVKLAQSDKARQDSRVLVCPGKTGTAVPLLQPLRGMERARTALVHVFSLLREPVANGRRTPTHGTGDLSRISPRTCGPRGWISRENWCRCFP